MASGAGPSSAQEQFESNTMRISRYLATKMRESYQDNRKAEAAGIAETLIACSAHLPFDLPFLVRFDALRILAASDIAGYVEWAREAVRYAELGVFIAENLTRADHELVEDCEKVLSNALERFTRMGGRYEEEEDVKEKGNLEEEGDVEMEDATADPEEVEVHTSTRVGATRAGQSVGNKRVRRVHSSDDDKEKRDVEEEGNAVTDPEEVEVDTSTRVGATRAGQSVGNKRVRLVHSGDDNKDKL
ncbi:hypothetical protein LTR08_005666 [Meristemomyces frigidus]|nr:hypothetical protein LTR08_005666 [Meristemomyces frigidus]